MDSDCTVNVFSVFISHTFLSHQAPTLAVKKPKMSSNQLVSNFPLKRYELYDHSSAALSINVYIWSLG